MLYNIGQSAASAKYFGIAYEAFELYLSKGGDDVAEQRRNEVMAEMDRLFKMVGSFDVVTPPGCVVEVDGMRHQGR